MALQNLTNNLITRVVPLDLGKAFSVVPGGTVFTASGFVGATAVPLGPNNASALQLDFGIGRMDAMLVVDLLNLKVSAGTETYQLALLASNDPAFGIGNCEELVVHDWAAGATSRVGSPYTGASPAVPAPGESVRRHIFPFTNACGGYLLRYLQLLLTVGGGAPSVTLNSWIADREGLAA